MTAVDPGQPVIAAAASELLVVAGEASGDAHGASVIAQLRQRVAGLRCFGLGGPALVAQGLERLADPSVLNVVGLSEVVAGLGRIKGIKDRLLEEVDRRRPRAALLVDLPGFNLHMAGKLKRRGCQVIYYVAPQAWAWRKGRVRKLRRRVDRLCVIFPFEQDFFRAHGISTEYVGHPLLERADEPAAEADPPVLALVPGSRPKEIARLLPALAQAAALLQQRDARLEIRVPVAPGLDAGGIQAVLREAGLRAQLVEGGATRALTGARLGLVTSGTATLEAALARVPMVVVYRVSKTTYALVRPFFQLEHVCIVNILAGRRLVPELLQGAVRPERIAAAAEPLLSEGPQRQEVLEGLDRIRGSLAGPRPSERVAAVLAEALQREAA